MLSKAKNSCVKPMYRGKKMCGDKVFPHYCYHTNHTTSNALLNSSPLTHMIKVSINITTLLQYFMTLSLASGNLPQPEE
jgi:hypothetical protein